MWRGNLFLERWKYIDKKEYKCEITWRGSYPVLVLGISNGRGEGARGCMARKIWHPLWRGVRHKAEWHKAKRQKAKNKTLKSQKAEKTKGKKAKGGKIRRQKRQKAEKTKRRKNQNAETSKGRKTKRNTKRKQGKSSHGDINRKRSDLNNFIYISNQD